MCARYINDLLSPHRPRLSTFDLATVAVDNRFDPMNIKGKIAEAMVKNWLLRAGFSLDNDVPRQQGRFRLEEFSGGIRIIEDGNMRCEFDAVAFHSGVPFIVQVKSGGLNGFSGKVSDYFSYGKAIYGGEPRMLLFFPQYQNKQTDAVALEREFPMLTCVDIGYKKKQIMAAVDRFMSHSYQSRL